MRPTRVHTFNWIQCPPSAVALTVFISVSSCKPVPKPAPSFGPLSLAIGPQDRVIGIRVQLPAIVELFPSRKKVVLPFKDWGANELRKTLYVDYLLSKNREWLLPSAGLAVSRDRTGPGKWFPIRVSGQTLEIAGAATCLSSKDGIALSFTSLRDGDVLVSVNESGESKMLSVEQKAVIGNQSLLATVDGAVMRLRPGHLALVPTPFRLASSDRSLIKGELPGGILISQVEIGAVILTGSGSKPVFDKDVVVHGCDYDLGAAWGWSHSSNKVMVWDDGRMVSLISDFVSPFSLQTSRVADGWAIAMQVSANDRTWSLVYSLRKVDGQWQLSRLIDVEGTICPNRGIVSSKGKVFIAFTDGSWKSVDVNQDTPRMTQ